ncbi:MAG TPA: adenosylmethionine--8-amino-7-oxononanoate transaminase [Gemmatimonadaceae bacterium]|nr:adenosylmethionine--8-amino-7-oxononanoate transaminase [Gemmatimonadaceae bacterium]
MTIAALDRAHVWHPYTQHAVAPDAVPIARAEGALLFEPSGRPIIDAISSWWVTLHGHAQPEIAAAIAEQARTLEQVIFAGYTHAPAAELAAGLAARLPAGLDRVFFSDNGSTAVEVAIKMALQYWVNHGAPRTSIGALEHAYHGDTFGAMSASARSIFSAPFTQHLFDVVRLGDPTDFDVVLKALDAAPPLAAVIVEPLLQAAGGMRVWPPELLRAIRERATLLIADEVLTGFGRTGPLFACETAGVTPDIICLSKGLTGGFLPLGATVVRDEIFEAFLSEDRRSTLFHGHSYTANPIACAAGRASLALLDEASAAKRENIKLLNEFYLRALSSHPCVENARVIGTIAAFDLSGGSRDYLNPVGPRLAAFALERGVLLRPLGNVVYVLPPYCITTEQLDTVYGVIRSFLEDAL